MPNQTVALGLVVGGACLAWVGLADPPGGIPGALRALLAQESPGKIAPKSTAVGVSTTATAAPASYTGALSARMIAPVSGPVTQTYAQHKARARYGAYAGIDYGVPTGTPVAAPASGVVTTAGWTADRGGFGLHVRMETDSGLQVILGHLSAVSVTVGQRVSQGTIVGRSGSTGDSTGPHVHFEVRRAGASIDPANVMGGTISA